MLQEIGAGETAQIRVYNKIDLSDAEPRVEYAEDGTVDRVWVSAISGAGLDLLMDALKQHFHGAQVHGWLHLAASAGSLRSSLYNIGQVLSEQVDEQGGWWLEVCMSQQNIDKLVRESGGSCEFHSADSAAPVAGAAQAS